MFTGTAGWTLPKAQQDRFPESGTHLQRYASVFRAVEINSSFYRPHSASTYAKWAAAVPADFRFSIKMPKTITHQKRFKDVVDLIDGFCLEIAGLGDKLGCLLVQLPPSFAFETKTVAQFFKQLRMQVKTDIACEPRHSTWFETDANAVLKSFKVTRVAADPAIVPTAAIPGGHPSYCYYRLHGSPRMYYSQYSGSALKRLARDIRNLNEAERVWCFFDNTATGSATANALQLASYL